MNGAGLEMWREQAPAKVNLVLHVGTRRPDGLHELCSLFASVDLVDDVEVEPSSSGRDEVECSPPLDGPNLAAAALDAYREATGPRPDPLPPLRVRIAKRIPVAAGLGGGSADAAAVLRAANALAGAPLDAAALRQLGARLGADVPSQVEPGHALVSGAGEAVERVGLPPMAFVLMPAERGLSTRDVYAEADRIGATRAALDRERVGALAALPLEQLAGAIENDLEAAAVSLRPELESTRAELIARGALAARVSGSGPTVFGVFADDGAARVAAGDLSRAVVARLRNN
jgi:4-diphosphocytidyl-2-C-methyl-D-erythritol kinase